MKNILKKLGWVVVILFFLLGIYLYLFIIPLTIDNPFWRGVYYPFAVVASLCAVGVVVSIFWFELLEK